MSVSVSLPSTAFDLARTPSSISGSMSTGKSIFGSLKHKLRRKNSNKQSLEHPTSISPKSPMNDQPYAKAPSHTTRRPDRPGMDAFTTPSNDPPPAYSPVANASAPSNTLGASRPRSAAPSICSTADDPYAFLSTFDTVFLIDDSGSMAGRSWHETGRALETIGPICTAHDADGIDIHFLNSRDQPYFNGIKSVATIREIFQTVRPRGGTPTGQRLDQILRPYLARLEREGDAAVKPLNVIVITDGAPSDDVESVLIAAARKLDRFDAPAWQVGVQFFQVGREPGAREHLKQLDDELAEMAGEDGLRDIVDTVPFTGEGDAPLNGDGILKCVLGAVNRRLDRRRSKDLHRR